MKIPGSGDYIFEPSPIFCNHANSVASNSSACPCDSDCYCKIEGSCSSEAKMTFQTPKMSVSLAMWIRSHRNHGTKRIELITDRSEGAYVSLMCLHCEVSILYDRVIVHDDV